MSEVSEVTLFVGNLLESLYTDFAMLYSFYVQEKNWEDHEIEVKWEGEGEGEFRQRGQLLLTRSHWSIQSTWKQCLHSGMHLTVSLVEYSPRHMGQMVPLGPGIRRLSPRTTFWYDSMMDSSRPLERVGGSASKSGLTCCWCWTWFPLPSVSP